MRQNKILVVAERIGVSIKKSKSVAHFSMAELIKVSRPISWLAVAMPFLVGRIIATGQIDQSAIWIFAYLTLPFGLLARLISFLPQIKNSTDAHAQKPSPSPQKLDLPAKTKQQFLWATIAINLLFLLGLATQGFIHSPLIWLSLLGVIIVTDYDTLASRMAGFWRVALGAVGLTLPLLLGLSTGPITHRGWYIISAYLLWQLANQLFYATAHQQIDFSLNRARLKLSLRKLTTLSMWLFLGASLILMVGFGKKALIICLLTLFFALNVAFYRRYRSLAQSKHLLKGYRDHIWLCYILGAGVALNLLWWWDPLHLQRGRMTILMVVILLFGVIQIAVLAYNLLHFKRPKTTPLPEWPHLSVILHTFNQADNINSTLLSLIGQNYPHYEIIIADLGSTDNTRKIIESYHDKKIKLVDVGEVPADWTIESWASQQLLESATGSIVVATSADVLMLPGALTNIASLVVNQRYDIVSLLPAEQNKSLAQKFILNHNHYFMLGVYPSAYLHNKNSPASMNLAGIMAFDRTTVLDIGGYHLVKKNPLRDLALPQSMRQHHAKIGFFLGSDIVVSQDHASWRRISRQNIQAFYPLLHYNFPLSLAVVVGGVFVSLSFVVGTAMVIVGTLSPTILALAYSANLLPRLVVARTSRQSIIAIPLYPISGLVPLVMLFLSIIGYEIFRPSQLSLNH